MYLAPTDTLQVKIGDEWRDIPVVEAERPPHPNRKEDRFSGIRRVGADRK